MAPTSRTLNLMAYKELNQEENGPRKVETENKTVSGKSQRRQRLLNQSRVVLFLSCLAMFNDLLCPRLCKKGPFLTFRGPFSS